MGAEVTDLYGLMDADRVDVLRAVIAKHGEPEPANRDDLLSEARAGGSTLISVAVQPGATGRVWYALAQGAAAALSATDAEWGTPDVYSLIDGKRAVVSLHVDGWVAGELGVAA